MAEAANVEGAGRRGSDANSLVLTATSSFSSTLSSSDLETESTTSFFPENGITLGSLIGIARGASAMADGDRSSFQPSTGVNSVNCCAGGTTSSQSLSFSHMSRIRAGAKLWSLLPCGSCKGFCYANEGTCRGFCFANKSNSCTGSSATEPLSSSLGHFLVAERDAERSLERESERSSNEAKVYINIMYEERTSTGHHLEEAAVNPLFDLDTTPATTGTIGTLISKECSKTRIPVEPFTWSRNPSMEAGLMPSLHAGDEIFRLQAARVGGTASLSAHAVVAPPGRPPSLPVKGQKALSNSVCH